MRQRIVKGKIIKISEGQHQMFAKDNIVFTAEKTYHAVGMEKGTSVNEPKTYTGKRAVKEISINTTLDKGGDYKNNGALRDGMIYGKKYEIEASGFEGTFTENDYKQIKWGYRIETENGISDQIFGTTGKKIILSITGNTNLCGRGLTIYAWIERTKSEAVINTWIHYRFRWFGREQIRKEIAERQTLPWKINQSTTSLCGVACIAYLLAKEDSLGFEKLALALHQQGCAKHHDYIIEPDESLFEMNPKDSACKYPHSTMPYIDWILLASLRSSESLLGYQGKAGEDFKAINWPGIILSLGKKFMGFKFAEIKYYKLNKSYIRDYLGSNEKLRILDKQINTDYQNGFRICMMIDGDMMYGKDEYSLKDFSEYHWIVYEGGLRLLNASGGVESDYGKVEFVKFKEFTWGEDVQNSRTSRGISKKSFISNYYAYIRFK